MSHKTKVSRRRFLQAGAGLAAASSLAIPRSARAAPIERKFLFFFAGGGWDTTTVLDPHFKDNGGPTGGVDMDAQSYTVRMFGDRLAFTGGPDRVGVERFFSRWGNRAAIVNGINAHSVGHDSAMQFVMTGTSASSYADWPTLLASQSSIEYPLPHVVFSGPSYAGTQGQAVVRAGGGSLLDLLDGSIVGFSDRPAPIPAPPSDSIVDAFVYKRVEDFTRGQRGIARIRAEGMLANLERSMELEGRRFEAGLSDLGNNMLDQAIKATEMFRLGLSRCAMISIPGGWDSHGNNTVQAVQQEAFYTALDELMDHLQATPGNSTQYLIDEVVLVALSEIGRTPLLNGGGGKDHWPYTSSLVVGSGVRGGWSVGRTDDSLRAEPISLADGLPSTSGDLLGCENLGLALLKLGGLEPARYLPGVQVLDAILQEA